MAKAINDALRALLGMASFAGMYAVLHTKLGYMPDPSAGAAAVFAIVIWARD